MVESNHDEERLARIEHMLERLQRETLEFRRLIPSAVSLKLPPTTPTKQRTGKKH
jgi:hypothetical protein